MALTSGAKKFLGLLVTVAVVGGGIFAYKANAPAISAQFNKPAAAEVVAAPEPAPVPQPVNSPILQAEQASKVVDTILPTPAPEPVQAAPTPTQHANPTTNRGMAALLGNKK